MSFAKLFGKIDRLVDENKDFTVIFYLRDIKEAVIYHSDACRIPHCDEKLESDGEWITIHRGNGSCLFRWNDVVCADVLVNNNPDGDSV